MQTVGVSVAPGVGFEPTRPRGVTGCLENSRRELKRICSLPDFPRLCALGDPGFHGLSCSPFWSINLDDSVDAISVAVQFVGQSEASWHCISCLRHFSQLLPIFKPIARAQAEN
jgi:hypothetical protein